MMNSFVIIRGMYNTFKGREKKIADFLLTHPKKVVDMNISMLAKKAGCAESSIVRFCKNIGFSGYSQLKLDLAKNLPADDEPIYSDILVSDQEIQIASKVFALSIRSLSETIEMLSENQLKKAVDIVHRAKKIEFYGIGTSSSLADDAYYRFMRIGIQAVCVTDPHRMQISASKLDEDCAVIAISHLGYTKEVFEAVKIAKQNGADIICVTSHPKSPIALAADAVLAASTTEAGVMKEAISSRIAHIALLDTLYTCVAIREYDRTVQNLKTMNEILTKARMPSENGGF